MTAHVDNFPSMLDVNRTHFHAAAAGGAGPDGFLRNAAFLIIADEGEHGSLFFRKEWAVFKHVLLNVADNQPGIELLAGDRRGANLLAVAANNTGDRVRSCFQAKLSTRSTPKLKGSFKSILSGVPLGGVLRRRSLSAPAIICR